MHSDISGQSFHRLKIIKYMGRTNKYKHKYLCLCECGNEHVADYNDIITGHTKSCGCYGKDMLLLSNIKHGKGGTKIYNTWKHLIGRCVDKKNKDYKNYGERGIKVCPEWLKSFDTFAADMGEPPSPGHTIERTDVNKGYSKDNCIWLLAALQGKNRRNNHNLTYQGKTQIVTDWSNELNIPLTTILNRIYRNLSIDQVLSTQRLKHK